MFNENEIILRVLVVKMDKIIYFVHEHEFYTKIEKYIFLLFLISEA